MSQRSLYYKENKYGRSRTIIGGNHSTVILVGSTGSGKTIAITMSAISLKKFKNFKVIYITEKDISPMENAFMGIEAKDKTIREKQHQRFPDKEDIEIYHPFTFNFKKQRLSKLPDVIKLFTLSLKETSDEGFSALLGRDLDSPTIALCQENRRLLKPDENIFTFITNSFKKSSITIEDSEERYTSKSSKQNWGLPIESYGGKRDIGQIKRRFFSFQEDYFLREHNCELNLKNEDMKKILQNDKITFFSTGYLKNKLLKYFTNIEILEKIRNNIKFLNKPLLIIFEEIKILLPELKGLKQEDILSQQLRSMLSEIRSSNVSILASSQSYFETNKKFLGSTKDVVIMKIGSEDRRRLIKEFNINVGNAEVIKSLRTGEFAFLDDLERKKKAKKFMCFYTPYCHREEGYPEFVKYWNKVYPDKVINHYKLFNKLEKEFKDQWKDQQQRIKEMEKARKEAKKKEEKKEKEVPKEKGEECYKLTNETPDHSWNARTLLIDGIDSPVTVQKIAVSHALKTGDFEFIKKHSSETFIKNNFLEYYEEIYGKE